MDERCGKCHTTIRRGEPLLEFFFAAVKHPKKRCVACADYPLPDDLPALVDRAPVSTAPMVHLRTGLGMLPLDFKTRQVEREPGEDDV